MPHKLSHRPGLFRSSCPERCRVPPPRDEAGLPELAASTDCSSKLFPELNSRDHTVILQSDRREVAATRPVSHPGAAASAGMPSRSIDAHDWAAGCQASGASRASWAAASASERSAASHASRHSMPCQDRQPHRGVGPGTLADDELHCRPVCSSYFGAKQKQRLVKPAPHCSPTVWTSRHFAPRQFFKTLLGPRLQPQGCNSGAGSTRIVCWPQLTCWCPVPHGIGYLNLRSPCNGVNEDHHPACSGV